MSPPRILWKLALPGLLVRPGLLPMLLQEAPPEVLTIPALEVHPVP